jgi:hypothetical protein
VLLRGREATIIQFSSGHGMVWTAFPDAGSIEAPEWGMVALDLSDPAGMDRAARWLAEHHGLRLGATAPNFWSSWIERPPGTVWRLTADGKTLVLHEPGDSVTWNVVGATVPGISAITDPAEALRLACLAARRTP